MAQLERVFESLAARGTVRGADALIDRLELELSSTATVRRWPPRSLPSPAPGWRRGLVVAASTAAAILVVAAVAILLARLSDDSAPVATTVPITPAPDLETLTPEALFNGLALWQGDTIGVFESGEFAPLAEGESRVTTALSDMMGGVVFQRDDTTILHVPAGRAAGAPPLLVARAGPGVRLSLEDVANMGDEPVAIVVRFEPGEPGEKATLVGVGLVSSTATDIVELSDGTATVDRVSHGGGRFLVTRNDGPGTRFEFRDESGAIVSESNNPRPVVSPSAVSQGVLADDGGSMVYIDRGAADAGGGLADLVTFDLARGAERSRDRLADVTDRIVAFDRDRVIITRRRTDADRSPLMVALHLGVGATLSDGGFSIGPPSGE